LGLSLFAETFSKEVFLSWKQVQKFLDEESNLKTKKTEERKNMYKQLEMGSLEYVLVFTPLCLHMKG